MYPLQKHANVNDYNILNSQLQMPNSFNDGFQQLTSIRIIIKPMKPNTQQYNGKLDKSKRYIVLRVIRFESYLIPI